MSTPVVSVHHLGKRYVLGGERHDTLRDRITHAASGYLRKLSGRQSKPEKSEDTEFWALDDVCFDVYEGGVVGIIGRNGAGKSTLLKILSQITEPTRGEVRIRGRVASLLEVGTGFHPELSGRENVFLNGAILGMTRSEITSKFDEIVAFAEIEKFIDTPVKRYSSGMYVRLAFAVAAHLEPEILIVDEVLAVGDAQFQNKCMGKMGDVTQTGRTVLFVSHNLSAVRKLCKNGVYLRGGKLAFEGPVETACERYLADTRDIVERIPLGDRTDRKGTRRAKFTAFHVEDASGAVPRHLRPGEDYTFVMEYENVGRKDLTNIVASIAITDDYNQIVFLVRSTFSNQNLSLNNNAGRIECRIKDFNLAQGTYSMMLYLGSGETEMLDLVEQAAQIVVGDGNYFGTGSQGLPSHCKTLTRADWKAV